MREKCITVEGKTIDSFVIKVLGRTEFLHTGNRKIGDYEYVRQCVCKNKSLFLAFVEVSTLAHHVSDQEETQSSVLNKVPCRQAHQTPDTCRARIRRVGIGYFQ